MTLDSRFFFTMETICALKPSIIRFQNKSSFCNSKNVFCFIYPSKGGDVWIFVQLDFIVAK